MKIKQKSAAPGDLADELAQSKGKRDAAIQTAHAKHETTRQGVIDRGTERVKNIEALQQELAREYVAVSAVVETAKAE